MFFWESYQKASLFGAIALFLSIIALYYIGLDKTSVLMAAGFTLVVFFATWIGFAASDSSMSAYGASINAANPVWADNYPETKRWNQLVNSDPNEVADRLMNQMFTTSGQTTLVKDITPRRRSTDGKRKRNR